MVYHNFESSIVAEVKYNQHLDSLFMELKESVLCKFSEAFSQGVGYLSIKVGCVCRMWMTYEDRFWIRLMVTDIPFIRVPQRRIVIFKRSIG